MAEIASIQVGRIGPLGPNAVPSAFDKRPVAGPVAIGAFGLAGDDQADKTCHGGGDKAVYGYPEAHYAVWQAAYPEHAALFQPGGMGENLTIRGLDEEQVCLGDILRIGGALLQVSDVREPCFKFALRYGDKRLPKAMVKNGLSGWYLRVLEPGLVACGDPVAIIRRLNEGWPIRRVFRLTTGKSKKPADIAELAGLEGAAARLRRLGA